MFFKRIKDRGESIRPLKRLVENRVEKGPVLRRLREEFFRSATKVLDAMRFEVSVLDDIKNASDYVMIISPYLYETKIQQFLSNKDVRDALDRGLPIYVVTRPAEKEEVDNPKLHAKCIKILRDSGFHVVEVPKLHFKSVIADNRIIYIGSINLLSQITIKYVPPDYMIRFDSEALVDEIIENALGRSEFEEWLSK